MKNKAQIPMEPRGCQAKMGEALLSKPGIIAVV